MPTTYQPNHVARLLLISPTSLRRYAADFGDLLPDYQHRRDQKREFTADDVGMLAAILQEMAAQPEGTTRSKLHDLLLEPGRPPLIPLTIREIANRPTTQPGPQPTPTTATREAAQGDVGSSSTPASLATIDAATIATFQATVGDFTAALTDQAAASREAATALVDVSANLAQLISQQAAAEARREARERRGEMIQWIVATVLIVATVAALVILATVGR